RPDRALEVYVNLGFRHSIDECGEWGVGHWGSCMRLAGILCAVVSPGVTARQARLPEIGGKKQECGHGDGVLAR
ncbi:MAG: hypothetical protein ACR2J8_06260, partial [Thermomicrobiales bacterium]